MKIINNEMNPVQIADGGAWCFVGCAAGCVLLWETGGAFWGSVGFFLF